MIVTHVPLIIKYLVFAYQWMHSFFMITCFHLSFKIFIKCLCNATNFNCMLLICISRDMDEISNGQIPVIHADKSKYINITDVNCFFQITVLMNFGYNYTPYISVICAFQLTTLISTVSFTGPDSTDVDMEVTTTESQPIIRDENDILDDPDFSFSCLDTSTNSTELQKLIDNLEHRLNERVA